MELIDQRDNLTYENNINTVYIRDVDKLKKIRSILGYEDNLTNSKKDEISQLKVNYNPKVYFEPMNDNNNKIENDKQIHKLISNVFNNKNPPIIDKFDKGSNIKFNVNINNNYYNSNYNYNTQNTENSSTTNNDKNSYIESQKITNMQNIHNQNSNL